MNLYAVGSGTVYITVPAKDITIKQICEKKITLHNVLFVPDLISNKARVTRLLRQRAAHTLTDGTKPTFISSTESAVIHFGSYLIELDLEAHRNMLTLHNRTTHNDTPSEVAMATMHQTTKALPAPLWHKRLGHISVERLHKMQQPQLGILIKEASTSAPCEFCATTKSVRLPNGNGTTARDFKPFEKVECDIWSHSVTSIRGFNHMLGFTCYKTGFLHVYLMRTKDQSPEMPTKYLR